MKRFLSYGLVYILITFFFVAVVACICFILDGTYSEVTPVPCTAVVTDASSGQVVSDTMRGMTTKYRTSTAQTITVKYTYNGSDYKETKQVFYDSVIYNSEPNTKGMVAKNRFRTDSQITIYVDPSNPHSFDIDEYSKSVTATLGSILKLAVPVYLVILIGYTWTVIQKEKAIKKQALYDSIKR